MNTEPIQGFAAGAAATSPFWLPAVNATSEWAALLLPILGAVWLVVQIGTKLFETFRRKKAE